MAPPSAVWILSPACLIFILPSNGFVRPLYSKPRSPPQYFRLFNIKCYTRIMSLFAFHQLCAYLMWILPWLRPAPACHNPRLCSWTFYNRQIARREEKSYIALLHKLPICKGRRRGSSCHHIARFWNVTNPQIWNSAFPRTRWKCFHKFENSDCRARCGVRPRCSRPVSSRSWYLIPVFVFCCWCDILCSTWSLRSEEW